VNTRAPKPTLRRKLAIFLGSLLGLSLVVELSLRAFQFVHLPAVLPMIVWNADEDRTLRGGQGMFTENRAQLWVPRPGAELPYGPEAGETINAAGYRGPLRTGRAALGVLRIVALGDSSTFGMGVPYAETWCAQLEAELVREGLSAEVLDLGVIGFSIEQGLERFEALGKALRPDVVVAAFGAVNDHFWAQTMPDRQKIDARKQPAIAQRLVHGARVNLRVLHGCAWIVDRLRGEDREQMRAAWNEKRREMDAFNQGAGQVDWPGDRRVGLARFALALDELAERTRALGAELVLISMPRNPSREQESPVLVLYNQAVTDAAARLGARLFDARDAVSTELRGPPRRPWSELFLDAYHPSAKGHALFVRGLAPLIKSIADARRNANSTASGR
jgi:lysophospholipase L1-like esterase